MAAVKRRRPAEPEREPLDRELARTLLEPVSHEVFPGVRGRPVTRFEQLACQHCGGVHARNCPAVQEIEYGEDGKVRRVKFWPHGQWPADQVLWLTEVQEAAKDDAEQDGAV